MVASQGTLTTFSAMVSPSLDLTNNQEEAAAADDTEFHFSVSGCKEEEQLEQEKGGMVAADQLFLNGHLLPLYHRHNHHRSHYQAYPLHLPHQSNMATTCFSSSTADGNTIADIPPSSLQTTRKALCHSKWKHIFSFVAKKNHPVDQNDILCLPTKTRAIKSGRLSLDGKLMSSTTRELMSCSSFVKGRHSDFSRDSSPSSLASCSSRIVLKKREDHLSLRDVLCSSSNGVPEKSSSCYSASVRIAPVVSVPLHLNNCKRKNGMNIFALFSSSRKDSNSTQRQNINSRLPVNKYI